MRIAVLTLSVPPFDYRSYWWWMFQNVSTGDGTADLVVPSGIDQFQRSELELGTVHRLNIFADQNSDWDERERVEYSVKAYVYLSKLHQRGSFNRLIVADCTGAEPIITSNLSVLAPVWVKVPLRTDSKRGKEGAGLLETADRTFRLEDLVSGSVCNQWPPVPESWEAVVNELLRE